MYTSVLILFTRADVCACTEFCMCADLCTGDFGIENRNPWLTCQRVFISVKCASTIVNVCTFISVHVYISVFIHMYVHT